VQLCDAAGGPVTLRLALACADWPNTVAPSGTWSAIDLAASTLLLPVSASSPHPAPQLPPPPPPPAPEGDGVDRDSSHVQWQHGHDVLARTRFADVDHGSSYGGNLGSRCVEHYVGHVEIDRRTGDQQATGMTRFELIWPDVDGAQLAVSSEARLYLAVEPGAFDVRVELDVTADGAQVGSRRWATRIPRRWA